MADLENVVVAARVAWDEVRPTVKLQVGPNLIFLFHSPIRFSSVCPRKSYGTVSEIGRGWHLSASPMCDMEDGLRQPGRDKLVFSGRPFTRNQWSSHHQN